MKKTGVLAVKSSDGKWHIYARGSYMGTTWTTTWTSSQCGLDLTRDCVAIGTDALLVPVEERCRASCLDHWPGSGESTHE